MLCSVTSFNMPTIFGPPVEIFSSQMEFYSHQHIQRFHIKSPNEKCPKQQKVVVVKDLNYINS